MIPCSVLHEQLDAAGIPIIGISGKEVPFTVVYDPSATQAQIAQGNAIVAAFDGSTRVPRILLDIFNDIMALNASQKQNIGNDLFGPDHKWATDVGFNRAGLFLIHTLLQQGSLPAGNLPLFKGSGAAMYTQDNPYYLVKPSFDSTINIAGDQPL